LKIGFIGTSLQLHTELLLNDSEVSLTNFWPDLYYSRIESESYVTTDGQSASLSWYKTPIRGLRPDFYFRTEYRIRLTVTFLIPWGALSDERTGLSFVCAAGPCQRSLSQVLVPCDLRLATCDLRPCFTVSDLRLPFSSPPTTRRVTVEVFDPASTRVLPFIQYHAAAIDVTMSNSSSLLFCCHGNACVCSNLLPGKDSFVAICCSWNMLSEPLLSNGHLLRFHYSGFQPSHHSIVLWDMTWRFSFNKENFMAPLYHFEQCLCYITPQIYHCHESLRRF
jgi:hypothetical protein